MKKLIGSLLALVMIALIAFGGFNLLKRYFNKTEGAIIARVTVKWNPRVGKLDEEIRRKEALIRSEKILGKVVDTLALYELWSMSREKAYMKARGNIGVRKTDQADYVTVFYVDKNTEVAKQILRSVLQEHARYYVELQKEIAEPQAEVE